MRISDWSSDVCSSDLRFQDHALRIMARHGFAVRSIWRSEHEDKVEFVYLLDWPDAATMKAAWAAFMADPEWAAIKKETGARHGRFVDAISDRTLEPDRKRTRLNSSH